MNVKINNREIGDNHPPYIIAEMSANHNGKIENAKKIIKEAKKAGADAVKIQTYTADTITFKSKKEDFLIHGGLWDGKNLYELYEEAHLPWDWHKELFDYAEKEEITIFSSPFDATAVDLLEDLNAPAYKIASFEVVDLPLIKYAASTKKPLIISTGMANKTEIQEAIAAAKDSGCQDLIILHCVSGYPAPPLDYNLETISDMKKSFGVLVGLSDHTIDNVTAICSVSMGACLIEKHFTLNRDGGGPDDSFSMESKDLEELCIKSKIAWQSRGKVNYEKTESEKGNLKFRRSLYVVSDIKKGEIFSSQNIRSIRPGFGIEPKHIEDILGKKSNSNIEAGTALSWDLIKNET